MAEAIKDISSAAMVDEGATPRLPWTIVAQNGEVGFSM
jgi:hypothetical protein